MSMRLWAEEIERCLPSSSTTVKLYWFSPTELLAVQLYKPPSDCTTLHSSSVENTNSIPAKLKLSKLMLADSILCPSSLSHLTEGAGTPNATHVRTMLELWLASTVVFGVRKNTGTYSERWSVREIDKTNLENHKKTTQQSHQQ